MLHILLLILKIIGIILLCILGILLLGIFCVLFVPVRYRIEAARQEGEGSPPVEVRVKVTWLLHLINLLVRFDGALFFRARIAFFTVFKLPKKEKRAGKKSARTPSEAAEEEPLAKESEEKGAQGGGKENPADEEKTGEDTKTDEEGCDAEADLADKPSLFDKLQAILKIIRDIFQKIKSFFENIRYTIGKFCDKIGSISCKIAYYRDILEGEPFKRALSLCKGELLSIAKSLKPDQFEAQLVVGLADPASTGEVLAVCGMLYPLLGGHVDVAGDFENKRLEGRVFIKGKLRFFTFLRVALKIYFNRDIKKLIRLFKEGGSVNG